MTNGLLQRLAEQTLGLTQALRSQLAISAAVRPAPFRTPSGSAGSPSVAGEPVRVTPVDAPPSNLIEAASQVLLTPQSASTAATPLVQTAENLNPGGIGKPGRQTSARVSTTSRPAPSGQLSAQPSRGESATPLSVSKSATPPAPAMPDHRAVPDKQAAPAPLLPAQPLSHRVATAQRQDPRREHFNAVAAPWASLRTAEVHVSIGRVELTAIAAPPNAPRAAPRARDGERSLADYLRAGSKGPS